MVSGLLMMSLMQEHTDSYESREGAAAFKAFANTHIDTLYIYIYTHTHTHTHTHTYILYILWRVGCLPLIISISPSLNRRPSPGSRREWVCERGGALKQPGLAACDEAHLKWMEPHHRRCYMPSAPLLWRPVSSPCMHTGVLVGPGGERWGNGCRRRRELPDPRSGRGPHPRDGWRARMPGRTIPRSAAGRRRTKPLHEAAAPYLDPSFLNTAHPSQTSQHDEDTRSPVYFGHFNPFRHCFIISV